IDAMGFEHDGELVEALDAPRQLLPARQEDRDDAAFTLGAQEELVLDDGAAIDVHCVSLAHGDGIMARRTRADNSAGSRGEGFHSTPGSFRNHVSCRFAYWRVARRMRCATA